MKQRIFNFMYQSRDLVKPNEFILSDDIAVIEIKSQSSQ